jgi:murein DD-endopeptidase MepM/ murein hydrolase activator NlpD
MAAQNNRRTSTLAAIMFALLLGGALILAALDSSPVAGATTRSRLESARAKLEKTEDRKGVLTSTLSRFDDRIAGLERRTTALREREAIVAEELAARQVELEGAEAAVEEARRHLEAVRDRLKRALIVLRDRLVAIYESGSPDIVSILVTSGDVSELAATSEYVARIQAADQAIVDHVRTLRDQTERTTRRLQAGVEQIEAARDQIAAREHDLAQARASVEARRAELEATRADRRRTLDRVEVEADHFGADVKALQQKIAEEITQASSVAPLPAGPAAGGVSSSGLIWPVEGVITSGFGPRWGSFHPGIDIGVPEGTPIRAAASGTVVLLQSESESGGYGNYTCIDHGGGLSTCYAHQTEFATSLGASVSQGEVIGYVGNTGFSTGPHLHFEVRIDGEPQDPLGYL